MNRRGLIVTGLVLILTAGASAATHAPVQANGPLGVTALAGKYTGAGVTIGVISSSFDSPGFDCLGCASYAHASDDVASGNLPGTGNPNGDFTPVVVLSEGSFKGDRNLGRVMLQVIYGIAPKAKLCFASVEGTNTYADAVAGLTSASGPCKANIIVDDGVFVAGDGAFSDGADSAAISQAVASGVTFLVAAGDQGSSSYNGNFKAVSDADARAGAFGNLKLSQVPTALTAGGFHDFSTSGTPQLSFTVHHMGTGEFSEWELDWDDVPDAAKVTADYKLLVFDKDGNYLSSASGLNHVNGAGPNGQAVVLNGDQQVAISLPAAATSATAARLRIVNTFTSDLGTATVVGLPAQTTGPSLTGRAGAAAAISVSSHSKDDPTTPEAINSCGPFTNAFDSSGNRLATAETRLKPDIAGIDNVDTTFFPASGPPLANDTDSDGFSNVPGSAMSAAAVGAVAALSIQAAGGTATPAQVASWLQQAAAHPSTWAPCDGYGLVNAGNATTLASGGSLVAGSDAGVGTGADAGAQSDAGVGATPPTAPKSGGCGTTASTGPLWLFAACGLLAAARARKQEKRG